MDQPGSASVASLPGIGPKRLAALAEAGYHRVQDLLLHLPSAYEDRRQIVSPEALQDAGRFAVVGRLEGLRRVFTRRRGLRIIRGQLADDQGRLAVVWFNQPYLLQQIQEKAEVLLYGEVRRTKSGDLEMLNPSWEPMAVATKEIVPVYPSLPGLSSRRLRSLVGGLLDDLDLEAVFEDALPPELLESYGLPTLAASLYGLHRPGASVDFDTLQAGTSPFHLRLAYGELLEIRGRIELARSRHLPAEKPHRYDLGGGLRKILAQVPPFALTSAQERVLEEILRDLGKPAPMQRLLQGDVGCGKTIVAALALVAAVENGLQGALMAPTEILAEQQFRSLQGLLGDRCRVELFSAANRHALEALAAGEVDVAVGTHALFQDSLTFRRLGLVIIDEQHRFGVTQRQRLLAKGTLPDLLVMTATPIPRSLALTVFGDLDCSVIDEMPPGRGELQTAVLPRARRKKVYESLARTLQDGGQAFVVLPFIEANEQLEVAALEREGREVRKWLSDCSVALVHGRLDRELREERMARFVKGEVQVLLATTVVEVGVDVPAARFMIIESAERFGMAQLHQLRGRVGRGREPAFCVALHGTLSADARRRLEIFESTLDGFEIAEADLAQRGSGDLEGWRQSGLPRLRCADLGRDLEWLERAREDARAMARSPIDASWSRFREALEERIEERDAQRLTGG